MSNVNELQTFNFNDLVLETITDNNGEVWFLATPLAKFLDYKNPAEAIRTNVDNDEVQKIYIPSKSNSYTFINESGLYSLIFRSNKAEAKVFKKWVTNEVLPSIRKTGGYQTQPNQARLPSFEEALKGVTVLADYLRLSNVGRIALVKPVVEQYGINAALPDYVNDAPPSELSAGSSKPVSTASELLKQHGIAMSAIKFNQRLHQHGVIEQLSRKSTKGVKKYWSITDDYMEYGKNDTSTSNPLEVQIHWYIHKFSELIDLVLTSEKAA